MKQRCSEIQRIQTGGIWFALIGSLFALPMRGQHTIHVPVDQPTIQAGIDTSKSGDIVLVAPGTYHENIDFKGKAITVTSGAGSYAQAASTIINGVGSGPVVKLMTGEPATAVLNGFTIQGGFANSDTPDIAAGVAVFGSSPFITNNIIENNVGCGLVIVAGASPTIAGNDIRRNLTVDNDARQKDVCYTNNAGAGVVISGAAAVVLESNIIEENSTLLPDGFVPGGDMRTGKVDCGGVCLQATQRAVFINNIIRNNASADINGISDDAEIAGSELVLIQNLFYIDQQLPGSANANVEIGSVSLAPRRLTVINNTFDRLEIGSNFTTDSILANNIIAGLDCSYVPQPPVISNNDIHKSTSQPCLLGSGNLTGDPQFINPAQGNFHTQRTSPVVAAGDIDAPQIPAADLDGKNRTVCGTIDMGVYEVHPQPATVVTSSPNPSVGGTDVTFGATVPGNCNVPTGSATFFDGTNALGTATLSSSATASLTTSSLTVGSHNITVGYPGDFNFDPSTSAPPLVQVVTGYPTATTLSLAPDPVNAFGPLTLTGTVSSNFGTPPGTVTFTANGTVLATVTLNANGQGTATISSLGAGSYSIVATYTATVNYAGSSSAAVAETVLGAESVTALSASPNPALAGQTVAFAVTVKPAQGSATPSGTVTFRDGHTTVGTTPLSPTGAAAFSTSSLTPGVHTITASYSGDANFDPSSASVTETVTLLPTATVLTASPNPAGSGQPVTLSAAVTAAGASVVPAGTLSFLDGGTAIGTETLDAAGHATLTVSTLAVGTHALTAVYQGFGGESGSTSVTVSEVIIASGFSLSLTPATLTLGAGQTGTVAVQLGSTGAYAGTLSLSAGALPAYVSGSFGSSAVPLQANGSATTALTISTQILPAAALHAPARNGSAGVASGTLAAMLLLPFRFARRRRRVLSLLLIGLTATVMVSTIGCAKIGYPIHTVAPGSYLVPVTAIDAVGSSKTANLTLVITP